MGAETEAADIIVRLVAAGAEQIIRLSGKTILNSGRAGIFLAAYAYGKITDGVPKQISENPGGMAMITIPEEHLERFNEVSKKYRLKSFSINHKNYDDGYVDICIKAEDVITANRCLEIIGVSAKTYVNNNNLSEIDIAVLTEQTFDSAKEKLASKSQTISDSLNRNQANTNVRQESYVIADVNNPDKYITITPKKQEFHGQERQYFVYEINNKGETKIFDDKMFENRPSDFWQNLRTEIASLSGINDAVYLNPEAHDRYLNLYNANGKEIESPVVDLGTSENAKQIAAQFEKATGKKAQQDRQQPLSAKASKAKSEKSNTKQKPGIKNSVNEIKAKQKTSAKGKSKNQKKTKQMPKAKGKKS